MALIYFISISLKKQKELSGRTFNYLLTKIFFSLETLLFGLHLIKEW